MSIIRTMGQDLLQIALEHHRAGRLRQAEAGYRAVLENDGQNAEAMHWLGALAFQAGRADEAILMLERAAERRPDEASFWHNLAQAYLHVGRRDDAIRAFERACDAEADRPEVLYGLGLAYLTRNGAGDAGRAVDALRQAREAGMSSAELLGSLAGALLADGRADEAIDACEAILKDKPEDAPAHYRLALAWKCKGDEKKVRNYLLKSLELEPTLAQAWYGLAMLESEAGNDAIAAGLFRRAIKARPDYTAAYHGLGRALQKTGNPEDAMKAFSQALRASRGEMTPPEPPPALEDAVAMLEERINDPQAALMHYAIAEKADVFAPTQVPALVVAKLFDGYAGWFDQHLTEKLQYRVPQMIADRLAAIRPDRTVDVLDLGCGTGLCGPLLRPMANRLAGVDLSPAMIEKARERGVYDELTVMDLVEAMRKAPRGYDILVAADVLEYVGDLSPTFEAAAAALRPGGAFVFTVEATEGERYRFDKKTRRFSHSKEYLEHLARIHGFAVDGIESIVERLEARQPVPGLLAVLRL